MHAPARVHDLLTVMNHLPKSSGISLKSIYFQEILSTLPEVGFLEIHPENYMSDGGLDHHYLTQIASHYPISMHGVGMSLGSPNGLNERHLESLKQLVDRYKPAQVSEHLSWSHASGAYFNDLLPVPLSEESFETFRTNIDRAQEKLKRKILIENPSTYLEFNEQTASEPEFLNTLCKQTGCGLLLDINNVYVCSVNHKFDPTSYLTKIEPSLIGEIHLAGHTQTMLKSGEPLYIDDHGSLIASAVWRLYEGFITHNAMAYPTLVEWDTNVPPLEVVLGEAGHAKTIIDRLSPSHQTTEVTCNR